MRFTRSTYEIRFSQQIYVQLFSMSWAMPLEGQADFVELATADCMHTLTPWTSALKRCAFRFGLLELPALDYGPVTSPAVGIC
jgi:hypothetical protein